MAASEVDVPAPERAPDLCPKLDDTLAQRFVLPGGHHFGGDYGVIATRILEAAAQSAAAAAQPSAGSGAP